MNVLIDNRQDLVEISEEKKDFVLNIVKAVLDYEKCYNNFEVSISFVDNKEIQYLNRQYRNKDVPTDVLSFPMLDFGEDNIYRKDNLENLVDMELPLGDIVISIEKAIEQARELGHSQDREIAFLLVHGMLHLLGYDHMNKKDEEAMFEKQKRILDTLGIKR